jgi:hypothetical protein
MKIAASVKNITVKSLRSCSDRYDFDKMKVRIKEDSKVPKSKRNSIGL